MADLPQRALTNRERKLLQGFANDYARFIGRVEERCEKFSDAMLDELLKACDAPTQTNCWFATYRVSPYARKAADHTKAVRAALVRSRLSASPAPQKGGDDAR